MEKIPTFAGCHLATHPKSRSSRSRRICLQEILLLILESSQHPSGLCPEEVALFVGLDGKYPSSGHIKFFGLIILISTRSKTSLSTQDFQSRCFASANCLLYPRTSRADASFGARERVLALAPAAFSTSGYTAFQHVSGLAVNSFREFNLCASGIVDDLIEAQ